MDSLSALVGRLKVVSALGCPRLISLLKNIHADLNQELSDLFWGEVMREAQLVEASARSLFNFHRYVLVVFHVLIS